jgi:diguanylate cyclase (GGDEF)-like protein
MNMGVLMTYAKTIFVRKTAALTIPLLGYLIASVFQVQLWGNILSPINALASSGILLFAYLRSAKGNFARFSLLLYSIAAFFWGAADIAWAVMDSYGNDPASNPVIWVIYSLPNLFIVLSLLAFAVKQFSKWNFVQICVDALIIGLMFMVFIWIVYLNKDASIFQTMMQSDFTSLFSIISDIIIFIGVFLWFLSVRTGKIPNYIIIIACGAVLFAFSDMLYYYIDFRGLYIPNSLIDFSYALSLYVMAFGALFKTYKSSEEFDAKSLTNIGLKSRWGYLLAFPFLTVLLDVTGVAYIDLNFMDIATYAVLIFLYIAFSKYVQLSIENDRLLTIQKLNNETLEQRVADQVKELKYLANQDTLTSLYNRRYFMNYLEESIKTIREKETLALLLLDMDRFKTINDSYGHDAGDKVLVELANRMTEWNNYGAIIARLGGDEFGLIFIGRYTQRVIDGFCAQITEFCNKPVNISGNVLDVTISIGVAMLSPDANEANVLMKNADIAMYQAKAQGYNRYQFFDSLLSQDMINSNKIEMLLKQVDIEKDFELYYQPQFSLPDKKLLGAEALIRWKNAQYGYIPPNIFIPVAEKIEYIAKIGKWVLKQSMRQAMAWNHHQSIPIKVGINISPRQLNEDAFIGVLKTLIMNADVNTAWLDAEITESTMIEETDKVYAVFDALKSLGISISIDDFGSGYSALSYLNKYPFDRIKIDKSLIDNISSYNISGVHIVKSIITMAKSIGIKTIAEGVETEDQLDVLMELGCDQVQGYLLGRPVPAQEFENKFMNLTEASTAPQLSSVQSTMEGL